VARGGGARIKEITFFTDSAHNPSRREPYRALQARLRENLRVSTRGFRALLVGEDRSDGWRVNLDELNKTVDLLEQKMARRAMKSAPSQASA
jgi:hypothetical protein